MDQPVDVTRGATGSVGHVGYWQIDSIEDLFTNFWTQAFYECKNLS
jgi:hypothetical protein